VEKFEAAWLPQVRYSPSSYHYKPFTMMLRTKPYMPMTLNNYINDQTYYQQMWTGAYITVLFLIGIGFYYYCCVGQNLDRLIDKAESWVLWLFRRNPKVNEGFEDYGGAEAVRIGLDLDDPESPKEAFVMGPQVWHPHRLMPIRRHISRTTSAPVFTVPLSPSDEPKKVW
jgi:hypothetical protein